MDERGREAIFEHLIGRLEPFVEVAAALADWLRLVAVVQRNVAFRPDLHRVRLHRLFVIEDVRQDFVVDRDQLQRVFGHVAIDRRDRGNRFTREADRIVECVAALRRDLLHLVVVLLAAGDRPGAPDDATVFVRDDRLDARERTRLRRVDAPDARMRVRASQHTRVEHARQLHVGGVDGLARDPLSAIDPRRRFSNRM